MFSFGILTHNEGINYLQQLIKPILSICTINDEIIIVDDYSTEESTISYLEDLKNEKNVKIYKHKLNNDFAQQKNFLLDNCSNDYIFLMDADEFLTEQDIIKIKQFVLENKNIDVFFIHRTNLLINTTNEILKLFNHKKNKKINETTYQVDINCYQERILKNNKKIRFKNKVHEHLFNFTNSIKIPETLASIKHIKTGTRQIKQAEFYSTINK